VPFPAGALSENADGYAGATRRGPTRSPLLLAKGKTDGAAGEERERERERDRTRARARASRENSGRLAAAPLAIWNSICDCVHRLAPRRTVAGFLALSLSLSLLFFPLFFPAGRDDGWEGEVFTMVPPFVVTEVISGRREERYLQERIHASRSPASKFKRFWVDSENFQEKLSASEKESDLAEEFQRLVVTRFQIESLSTSTVS